ncbi:dephospho-CoA kinase [Pseudoalteromonas xiamenensis]
MKKWVLGVTGGIGAGKSAVTKEFERLGIDVIDADIIARDVVAVGSAALEQIKLHFGETILRQDGTLNRAKLRERIFSNELEKHWLNNLLHPLISENTLMALSSSQSPYCILAAPLLFENQLQKFCQRTLLVDVPEEIQLIRTIERDQVSEQQVKAIISAQMSRNEKRALADDILDNSNALSQTYTKLKELHEFYLRQAQLVRGD